MSYDITVECKCCYKLDIVLSGVPLKDFLQGYIDRKSYYLCDSCWGKFYHKGVKFTLDLADEPINSRFEILDL